MKNIFVVSFIFLIGIQLGCASLGDPQEFGYNNLDGPVLIPEVNVSKIPTVNNSEYWDGNAWSNTRWLDIDGGNANQNIDISPYNLTADYFLGDWNGSLWTRTGTTLSPKTTGDDITTTGSISSSDFKGSATRSNAITYTVSTSISQSTGALLQTFSTNPLAPTGPIPVYGDTFIDKPVFYLLFKTGTYAGQFFPVGGSSSTPRLWIENITIAYGDLNGDTFEIWAIDDSYSQNTLAGIDIYNGDFQNLHASRVFYANKVKAVEQLAVGADYYSSTVSTNYLDGSLYSIGNRWTVELDGTSTGASSLNYQTLAGSPVTQTDTSVSFNWNTLSGGNIIDYEVPTGKTFTQTAWQIDMDEPYGAGSWNNYGIVFSSMPTNAVNLWHKVGEVLYNDNIKEYFGTGKDSSVYFDGTNIIINPKEVGSGYLSVLGNVKATEVLAKHKTADGTSAVADGTYNFYNDGVTSGQVTSMTIKDGIVTSLGQVA